MVFVEDFTAAEFSRLQLDDADVSWNSLYFGNGREITIVPLEFEAEFLKTDSRKVVIRSESRRNADDPHKKVSRVDDVRQKDSDPLTILMDLAGKWWKMTGSLKIHLQKTKLWAVGAVIDKGLVLVWFTSNPLSG